MEVWGWWLLNRLRSCYGGSLVGAQHCCAPASAKCERSCRFPFVLSLEGKRALG
jgi:hypothetical protein